MWSVAWIKKECDANDFRYAPELLNKTLFRPGAMEANAHRQFASQDHACLCLLHFIIHVTM